MKIYIITLVLILTLISKYGTTQDEIYYEQNVIQQRFNNTLPPSPTATALAEYAEIPVDKYTGVPNISIPLYTIELQDDFQMPVSLSYHASGIKVEDEASWVGLGWSLNAGGVITRSVKGLPDDAYYASIVKKLPSGTISRNDYENAGYFFNNSWIEDLYNASAFTSAHYEKMYEQSEGRIDGIPDIFYFNFLGYSGKFVFDKNKNPRMLSQLPIKIEFEQDSDYEIIKFVVTDEKGNKYYFEDCERTTTYQRDPYMNFQPNPYVFEPDENYINSSLENYPLSYNSSWYLTKIETKAKDTIRLSYFVNSFFRINNVSEVWNASYSFSGLHPLISNSADMIQIKRIKEIAWDNGKLSFSSNTTRLDCDPAYSYTVISNVQDSKRLDELTISNSNNEVIKSYKFNYSYFESEGLSGAGSNSWAYRRLKLTGLQEFDKNNTSKPQFLFEYNTTTLPHRLSFSQDFWGYYNGETNVWLTTMVYVYPNDSQSNFEKYRGVYSIIPRPNYSGNQINLERLPGGTANRNPSESNMQACMLKKITYPTGGTVEFKYNSHKYHLDGANNIAGGLRINEIISSSENDTIFKKFEYLTTTGNSSGKLIDMPMFASCIAYGAYNFIPSYHRWDSSDWLEATKFNSVNNCLGNTKGSSVGYTRVKEFIEGNGSVEYYYSLPASFGEEYSGVDANENPIYQRSGTGVTENIDEYQHIIHNDLTNPFISNVCHYPFPSNPNYDFCRGVLEKEVYFKEGGLTPIKKVEYTYTKDEEISHNKIYGFESKFVKKAIESGWKVYVCKYGGFYYLSAWMHPTGKRQVDYFENNDSLVVTTDYEYNSSVHKQLSKIETYTSNSFERKSAEFLYPSDINTGTYATMKNMNILSPVVEKIIRKNNNVIDSYLTTFKTVNSIPVEDELYKAEISSLSTNFNSFDGTSMDNSYANNPEIEYLNYDSDGNCLKMKVVGGLYKYFIRGYDDSRIVAQITTNISSLNLNSIRNNIASKKFSESDLCSLIVNDINYLEGQLNTYINNSSYQVELYTYKPLVGITSHTDVKGVSTFYEYDDFGRLISIRNDDKKLVESYEYHFKE